MLRVMAFARVGRRIVALGLLALACGKPEPRAANDSGINPDSVPSLALLGSGTGLDRSGSLSTSVSGSGGGRTCEAVRDEEAEKARTRGVDLEEPPDDHTEQIRAVLDAGDYLNGCDVPEAAGIELCAAILDGEARGVTVTMHPGTRADADCVADAVRRLEFPSHELVFIARTAFEPGS
jgi:hypothetical protein